MNKNGIQDAHVPIIVEPINDPPFIRVPEYVILEKGSEQYSQIVGKQDSFEFSVEDPDLFNFPGMVLSWFIYFYQKKVELVYFIHGEGSRLSPIKWLHYT